MKISSSKFVALITASVFFIVSCNENGKNEVANNSVPQYPARILKNDSVTLVLEYPCTLEGQQNVEIRPKIDGFVDGVFIDEGSLVKKGQLLFKIKAPQYQEEINSSFAAVNALQAEYDMADQQLQKTKPLVDKGIISPYELTRNKDLLRQKSAQLNQAQANLAKARTNLGYTNISSPSDGIVGAIPYKLGSLVSSTSSQPLTVVSNVSKIYAYFSFNEKEILEFIDKAKGNTMSEKIKSLPPVILKLANGKIYNEPGRIETLNGLLNSNTGSGTFKAIFNNSNGVLRSGGSATIRIPYYEPSAIVIPQQATYEIQGRKFVYTISDSGVVKNKLIEVSPITKGQDYVVIKGLKAGDKIVTGGMEDLKDGMKIKPKI